jgi:polysaccharide export outer membrane protein
MASLVARAGGLTSEAFVGGAKLLRQFEDIGFVVIDLETALQNPGSTANLIVRDGDIITIPKQPDLVTIEGAVNLRDLYPTEFLASGNRINVGYTKGKNAKYYIENYAAGLAEDGRKRLITVRQANGKIERTRNFLFFRTYPKVEKGATVSVGRVEPKPERAPGEKEEIDWGRVVSTTLAQATAILTLVLLIDRTID